MNNNTQNLDESALITSVLSAFRVNILSIEPTFGPSSTLYELQPAIGTRLSKIRNLKDELALALHAKSVRIIAPIPGRGTVGIEIPNKVRQLVSIDDIMKDPDFANTTATLPLGIGYTLTGSLLLADLATMPHLLIAGATGQGKSVCLNTILMSLITRQTPAQLQLMLIDPKQVEFTLYSNLKPFLAAPVTSSSSDAVQYINEAIDLMESRYTLLANEHVRKIAEYNALPHTDNMPYLVIVIDEYGDLIAQTRYLTDGICRLAQKARAVGIHLILSTQRPSVKIVTGDIKANFPVRIAFRMITSTDSRVVLGKSGAETLTGRGDMLFFNGETTVRAQCAFTPTDYVQSTCATATAFFQDSPHPRLFPNILTIEEREEQERIEAEKQAKQDELDKAAEEAVVEYYQTAFKTKKIAEGVFCNYCECTLNEFLEQRGLRNARITYPFRWVKDADLTPHYTPAES